MANTEAPVSAVESEAISKEALVQMLTPLFLTNSSVPDSFTGVPADVRPSLGLDQTVPDQQLPVLVDMLADYIHEVLTAEAGHVLFPQQYLDYDEEDMRTFRRRRFQMRTQRVDEHGWMHQLWMTELELSQDVQAATDPNRIDNRCRAEIASIVEAMRRLAETNVPEAALQKDAQMKRLSELMTVVLERTTIVLQMSNPALKRVKPLLGICVEKSFSGARVLPITVSTYGREVVDRTSPMPVGTSTNQSGWSDEAVYDKHPVASLINTLSAIPSPSK